MRSISEWKRIYNTEDFKDNYTYTGQDLGCTCTEGKTSFVLWSPFAEEVCLYLYNDGESGEAYGSFPMEKGEKGTWRWEAEENLKRQQEVFGVQENTPPADGDPGQKPPDKSKKDDAE